MKRVLLLLALAGSGPSATAATISDTAPFGPTQIGAPLFSVTLDKFNPALGTLQKVTLTLNASTTGSTMDFDNEAGSSGSVGLSVGTTVTASSVFLTALVATPAQTGAGTVAADNDGAPDYVGADAFGISGGVGSDSDFDSSTVPGVLTSFTATFPLETFSVDLGNVIFTSTSTSGIFGPTNPVVGTFSGDVTVTYEYIPEPSIAALIGLAGLAAFVRRRRA